MGIASVLADGIVHGNDIFDGCFGQNKIVAGRGDVTAAGFHDLEDGPRLLLFDAGTGLRRLLVPPGSTMLAAALVFLRLPTGRTAALADWEQKLDAVARESVAADVRGIGGTPSWLICVFERVLKLRRDRGRPANTLADVWPNLSLLVHGGVNFSPYHAAFEALFGRKVTTLEVYPASEGFMGVEDVPGTQDLLLMMDSGLFYEFIPAGEVGRAQPTRRTVADVETGVTTSPVVEASTLRCHFLLLVDLCHSPLTYSWFGP
jgi:hypothetical protein